MFKCLAIFLISNNVSFLKFPRESNHSSEVEDGMGISPHTSSQNSLSLVAGMWEHKQLNVLICLGFVNQLEDCSCLSPRLSLVIYRWRSLYGSSSVQWWNPAAVSQKSWKTNSVWMYDQWVSGWLNHTIFTNIDWRELFFIIYMNTYFMYIFFS